MSTAVADTHGPRRPGAFVALIAGAALAFAAFVALGVWQVQRLSWKEALIARVDARVHAAPVDGPGPAAWSGIDRESAEYLRVQLRGRYDHARETLVRASTVLGSGYWVLTPLETEAGWWLWVNRGFVPPAQRERASRRDGEPEGATTVIGLLRLSEPGGSVVQDNDPASGRWVSRDVQAITAARGPAGTTRVAPYFVDAFIETAASGATNAVAHGAPDGQTAPAAGDARAPHPGLTVISFPNNHLVYALTWFALAAGAVLALTLLLRSRPGRGTEPD